MPPWCLAGWDQVSAMQTSSEQGSPSFSSTSGGCCLQPEQTRLLSPSPCRDVLLLSFFSDVRMLQCCCWLCSSSPEPLDALSSARDGLDLHGLTSARPALPSPQGAAPRIRRLPCGLLCGNGECSSCLCMLLPRHLPAHNTPCQGCLVCWCSV